MYSFCKEWMIDNVVVPMATGYGLAKEYEYLKSSIREFLTGYFSLN
jgi:ubiquinone/menaquinone biosynthesis C-methylase UbiE